MVIDDPATRAEVEAAFALYEAALVGNDVAALARTLVRPVVTTFGTGFAAASTLFRRDAGPGGVGRQTRSLARLHEGRRLVAARVSPVPAAGPG